MPAGHVSGAGHSVSEVAGERPAGRVYMGVDQPGYDPLSVQPHLGCAPGHRYLIGSTGPLDPIAAYHDDCIHYRRSPSTVPKGTA